MGYSGLPCGYCNRPLRLDQEVARHRLEVARIVEAIVLRTSWLELVVAQAHLHRSRLVVQGIYSDLRLASTLCDELVTKLHDEVAEIRIR